MKMDSSEDDAAEEELIDDTAIQQQRNQIVIKREAEPTEAAEPTKKRKRRDPSTKTLKGYLWFQVADNHFCSEQNQWTSCMEGRMYGMWARL